MGDRARTLPPAVLRPLSYAHSVVFAALLAVWIAPGMLTATMILGWAHGVAWIVMSMLVVNAARRRTLPWSMVILVAVVGVFIGPFAGSWGFARERRRAAAEPAETAVVTG